MVSALSSLRKGGVVAINAIPLDPFSRIRLRPIAMGGTANPERGQYDASGRSRFPENRRCHSMAPKVTIFPLDQANQALQAVKNESVNGAAVIIPSRWAGTQLFPTPIGGATL